MRIYSENRQIMATDGTGAGTEYHIRVRRKTCGNNSDCPEGLTCHDVILTKVCLTPGDIFDKVDRFIGKAKDVGN